MRYTRFEELILIVGGVTILGTVAVSYSGGPPELAEVAAQFMLFGVLFCAVRFGRRGGLIAAIVASAIYTLLRIDTLSLTQTSTTAMVILATRLAAFGLVGVAGGELCSRVRYGMATLEGASALDEWSRVYNQRWAFKSLDAARARFLRYDEPFSVVVMTISPAVFEGLRPSRHRAVVRGVADHIRADVRVVDEVSRLDDGRFIVLLPHTPKDGGEVAAARLKKGTVSVLGARAESLVLELLGASEDPDAIDALLDSIAPHDPADQGTSGAYNSEGASTRNPAAESTASAR